MRVQTFERSCELQVSASEAFDWHTRPGAFERLLAPWQRVRVVAAGPVEAGSRLTFRLCWGPLSRRWVSEHREVIPGQGFQDVQLEGPFASWNHRHRLLHRGGERSELCDHIEYVLPGSLLARPWESRIRRALERSFRYRHSVTAADLAMHAVYRHRPRLRVAISGASGLVGSSLASLLKSGGHQVTALVRRRRRQDGEAQWDPERGVLDLDGIEDLDALVHLAGENIAGGRWTRDRKRRIRDSRVAATEALVASLSQLKRPPKALLCASAVGYYGTQGEAPVSEDAPPGDGFLARVCIDWEAAARQAEALCGRVCHLRFGVVLSPAGGALNKMLPAFRLGLGGPLGNGRQRLSWIGLDDAIAAIHHLLLEDSQRGAFNLSAPHGVDNLGLTRELGRLLRRPTWARVPASVLRLLLGEMADQTLLASCEAKPRRLEEAGFAFRHPKLSSALAHLLGIEPRPGVEYG